MTRQKILKSIRQRVAQEIAPQSTLKYLTTLDPESYVDAAIATVYLYTRAKKGAQQGTVFMAELVSAMGHAVRNKLKLKKNSAIAAKTGAFILYTFEVEGLLRVVLGAGARGHNSYIVQVLDDESVSALWDTLDTANVEKLPSETPYEPWTSSRHATGASMVKTGNKAVLDQLTPETHPIVFDCINKAQKIGWTVHEQIYNLHLWALRNKSDAFAEIWEQQNPEAKTTKLREARAIGNIAKRFAGKTFYHLYYFDFRARKYPTTAYLHEQGSDLARGLLRRADKLKITEDGFFWLLVTIANNWAGDAGREDAAKTDKIPLKDRAMWVLDNEEIILSYAEKPKVNQGWMKADKPWQFLAACLELMQFRLWQMAQKGHTLRTWMHAVKAERPTAKFFKDRDVVRARVPGVKAPVAVFEGATCSIGDRRFDAYDEYGYESHLEAYIDGTNNGCQHLAALTRDEITAPHVNLVPSALPGDLYKYVGDHVWSLLAARRSQLTPEDLKRADEFIDALVEFKQRIHASQPKSEQRKELVAEIRAFKEGHLDPANAAAVVYWTRLRDSKHRRKVVKRNIMTLPYGGTAYGLGQQQIDDARKHGIELLNHMEHKWGAFLGREIYEGCKLSIKRPMQLLSVFEKAGKDAEARGEFLSWRVPITDFPVVQNYTEGTVHKIWVQYGPPSEKVSTGYYKNTLQLNICFVEDVVPSKGKQSSGASPNAIHSLDAGHLALTVHRCDFPVTTIHDSYGCLLADMPKLFKTVRETFVELYRADPLTTLMKDIGGDLENVTLGNLDIALFLDSEFGFC
jgi:DNA-directed RNA polymerase